MKEDNVHGQVQNLNLLLVYSYLCTLNELLFLDASSSLRLLLFFYILLSKHNDLLNYRSHVMSVCSTEASLYSP